MVDDDLEVAVRAALVLERVLDLGYRALERRGVVLAHRCGRIGVEDRLGIFEAHRRPGVDGEAAINERDCLIDRDFLLPCVAWRFWLIRSV